MFRMMYVPVPGTWAWPVIYIWHSAISAASRKYPEASAPPNLSPLEILGRTTPAAYFICFCATYTPQCERVRVICVHIDLWVRMISTSYQQTRKKKWSPTEFWELGQNSKKLYWISKFKKYVTILNPDYFFDMLVGNENDTFQIHICQFLEANGSQYLTPMKIFVKVKNLSTTTKFVS